MTLSVGVGTIVPKAEDATLAFIDAVDRALYKAKESGRNAVVVMR